MCSCGIQLIEPILGSFVRASFQVLMVRINSPLIHESRVLMVITHDIVALEFTRWQASVEALARPLLSALRSADDNRPPFGSEVWWSCLVYRRLQHLDLVFTGRKHLGVSD